MHALDLEAVLCDRVAMGAARNEKYIVACRRQAGTEISADRTRRHCRNTHASKLLLIRRRIAVRTALTNEEY